MCVRNSMTARLSLFAVFLSCATAFAVAESPDAEDSPAVIESTSIIFTRSEIAQMAALWETDTIAISSLANSQYPTYTTNWQYIFPHTSISADGDVHIDMAVDVAGTGSSGNNTGASPIVCEVINAVSADLSHLGSLNAAHATFRGIFRFYTEHPGERHFE